MNIIDALEHFELKRILLDYYCRMTFVNLYIVFSGDELKRIEYKNDSRSFHVWASYDCFEHYTSFEEIMNIINTDIRLNQHRTPPTRNNKIS